MNKNAIRKNIKDLEYQTILNLQNIVLGIIGTAIVSLLFVQEIPKNWPSKENIIFTLIFMGLIFFFYFNKRLNEIISHIKRI
jgi:undecaprenyl pyrophosphate phosphatase UppP